MYRAADGTLTVVEHDTVTGGTSSTRLSADGGVLGRTVKAGPQQASSTGSSGATSAASNDVKFPVNQFRNPPGSAQRKKFDAVDCGRRRW
ncbi:hypothetical protein CGZ93_16255 [Enemella dayhoffiae]|uniref:Uncharacterized protein n=1 Tax=Enemella dayhoffiae TaxID=2016507 RepID=A0A255GQK8_9ACTN|nr:hypothetical protein [Enemella dayhoffiae]OYO18105.1 hypothetical protein CGZ93_16255 [Enemella dayhoffiae]